MSLILFRDIKVSMIWAPTMEGIRTIISLSLRTTKSSKSSIKDSQVMVQD